MSAPSTPAPAPSEAASAETPSVAAQADAVKIVQDHAPRMLVWDYERSRGRLVTLYNKATASQWRAETDLDWSIDVDPERLVDFDSPAMRMVRAAKEVDGSPLARWGEREMTTFGVEMFRNQISQFMHGEQAAMMTAAKLVETVPWIDARYYAATQTMDEARHTEVFAKYLDTKLGGEPYPVTPFVEKQITALLEDSRWDFAYLGMQIVLESLALAAFGMLLRRAQEPLLHKMVRYVLSDEARHVAFGVISLSEYYTGLTEAELRDRQEFLVEASLLNQARTSSPEVWERMGTTLEAAMPSLMEGAAKVGAHPFAAFLRDFHSKLVPNVRKLGLLDANDGYLRKQWAEHGLLEYEHADATGSDYASYDVVARDRAASAA